MQFCIIYLTSNIWCLHTWPMWDLTRFFHHFLTTPPTSMVLSRNVKLLSGKEKMKRKRNSRRKRRHHSQTSCPCSFIFMDSDELGLVRQWLIPCSVGRSLPLVGTWFVVFLSATMSFQGMVHKGAIYGLWRQQKPKRIRKLVASQQSKGLESLGAKVCSPVNSCSVLSFKVVLVILKIFKVSPELNLYKKCSFVWHFEVPRAKVAPKERLAEPWTFLLDLLPATEFPPPPTRIFVAFMVLIHRQFTVITGFQVEKSRWERLAKPLAQPSQRTTTRLR